MEIDIPIVGQVHCDWKEAERIGCAAVEPGDFRCWYYLYPFVWLLKRLIPPLVAIICRWHFLKQQSGITFLDWYRNDDDHNKIWLTCILAVASGWFIDKLVSNRFHPSWWFLYVRGSKHSPISFDDWHPDVIRRSATPIGIRVDDWRRMSALLLRSERQGVDTASRRSHPHLRMGMTRYAMRDVATALLNDYTRTAVWINQVAGSVICGYDMTEAIKTKLESSGLASYSVAEVMLALGNPGVHCQATVFVSHVQSEAVEDTFRALKYYAQGTRGPSEPTFWLDYFILRQCKSDFVRERIADTIKNIGRTILITEQLGTVPVAVTRTFCVFEVYATLKANNELSVVPATSVWCVPLEAIRVDLQASSCRSEAHKGEINALIDREVGFDFANAEVANKIELARSQFLIRSLFDNLVGAVLTFLLLCVVVFYYGEVLTEATPVDEWKSVDCFREFRFFCVVKEIVSAGSVDTRFVVFVTLLALFVFLGGYSLFLIRVVRLSCRPRDLLFVMRQLWRRGWEIAVR